MSARRWTGLSTALLIAVAALAIRLGHVWSQGSPERLSGDAFEYDAYAVGMLRHGEFAGPAGERAARMPGYPLFLWAVYSAAGRSWGAVQAAQCALGALTCLLLFLVAAELLEPPWPAACAAAYALNWQSVAACSSVLTEPLFACLLTAAFAALHRGGWPAPLRAACAGLAFGAAYWVRPEILPYGALLLAALPLLRGPFRARDAAAGLAAVALFVGLWTGRNLAVLGRPIPLSTMGHRTAYLGLRLPLEKQGVEAGPLHEPPAGLGELEVDRTYAEASAALAARLSPLRRAKAHAFNLLSAYYPFLPEYDVTYAVLLPFFLLGLWACRERKELWPVAGAVLALSASYTFFGGPVSRYRLCFAPLLILLAGAGGRLWSGLLPARRAAGLASAWAALNLACWVWAPSLRAAALALRDALWR